MSNSTEPCTVERRSLRSITNGLIAKDEDLWFLHKGDEAIGCFLSGKYAQLVAKVLNSQQVPDAQS